MLWYFDIGTYFYMFEGEKKKKKKKKKIKILYYKTHHEKLYGDNIINSLICIFISTVQEMLHGTYENSQFHIFLI